MKKSVQLCSISTIALALSACSSVANQTPDEMYRTSIQRQFKQDAQYNFTGKVFVQVQPNDDSNKASEARQSALDSMIEHETARAEWYYRDEPEMQKPAKVRERAEQKLAKSEKIAQHFSDSLSVPFSGAWDLPNGKFEMVPEIRYETRNLAAHAKFPLQINAKEQSVLIDPAAVSVYMDLFAPEPKADFERINNRYLRVKLPENVRQFFPMKDLFGALPKAFDDAHAVLDKNRFKAQALDERAKRLGATHKISYTSNKQQDDAYIAAMLNSMVQQLEEKQKNGTAQSNITAENYSKFIEGMKAIAQEVDKSSKEVKTVSENDSTPSTEDMLKSLSVETTLYLNKQGRMLAYVQQADLPQELTKTFFYDKRLRLTSEMELQYNKQPVFQIHANEHNTVDLEKVSPDFKKFVERLNENIVDSI